MLASIKPTPLIIAQEPFDDPDWLFEAEMGWVSALAHIQGHDYRLVSRRGNIYKS